MRIQRKTFRYEMRKQENAAKGTLAKTADRLKVLRSVLAASFAVLPFFANEAFAAGEITRVNDSNNLMQNGKADIYAESVSGNVGLNRFQSFKVEQNELANMYFRTKDNASALNTLVNTVNERIDIYGTVNAIRNNKVGGNLYFLSPKGMVVGAGGVINAGSLTVMTAENSFTTATEAQETLTKNDWKLNSTARIDIHGKLNTATGIDLRAAYINVKKENKNAEAPLLRTGLLFDTTVNNDKVTNVSVKEGRLQATVDSSGNVVIADPNDSKLTGDGSINLKAEAKEKNKVNNDIFDRVALTNLNAVESGVEVGSGAEIDALGDVNISATATYDNQKYALELWDAFALSKADVKVDGNVKGYNVNLKAEATSSLSSDNMKNLFDTIDRAAEDLISINGEPLSLNDAMMDSIENLLIDKGVFKKGTSYFNTLNNVAEQLYMPFGFVEANAAVSQGAASQIVAQKNLTAVAKSTATNNFSVAIQPKVREGDFNVSKYFSGGFIYVDTDSNATVDINGTLQAAGNMTINAAAINTSISSLVVKPPRTFENPDAGKDDGKKDDTASGTGGDAGNNSTGTGSGDAGNTTSGAGEGDANKDTAGTGGGTAGKDDSGSSSGNKVNDNGMQYAAVAVTVNSQDGKATVNLGSADSADKSKPKLKAGGALNVTATNVNTVVSNAIVSETENTLLNTAVNVAVSSGKAVINDNVELEGASVQLNSNNEMKKLSMNTDGSTGPELSGTAWAVNTPYAKHGLDSLTNFTKEFAKGHLGMKFSGQASSPGKNKVNEKTWRDAFNVGMSLGVALVENKAATNIAAGVPITATGGDIGLGAKVTIDDTQLITSSLLNLNMRDEYLGAVAAVSIQDMDNSAEVNIAADDKTAVDKADLQAKGNIKLNAEVDNSYKRLDNLVQAVEDGWKSFEATYDKDNADQSVRDAVQSVEGIVADILTMFNRNSATNFLQNKQFAMKSKAALDIITQIEKAFGADELVAALKNLVKASSYANMYVSASTDKSLGRNPDVTAMVSGTFGMQGLNNTAKVNVGANRSLAAGAAVDIDAVTTEQNALLAGKWQLIPDLFTTDAGDNGLGGTVGVQTASNNSEVIVNNGVIIKAGAGDIALNTKNDIINTSLVMGGAMTSSLGVTGMVNYVGGESNAKTLVDDDVNFIAHKKLIMGADNDTVLTAVAGDFGYSNNSSIGASVSVIDYDVKTLAQVRNIEENEKDNVSGTIVASGIDISAHTDGIINSFALAGSVSKSANENKDKGGTETATKDGKAKDGVEKVEAKAEEKNTDEAGKDDKKDDANKTDKDDNTKNDTVKSLLKDTAGTDNAGSGTATPTGSKKTKDSIIKVDAAGSVAWNYVNDETNASLEGVTIGLERLGSDDKTTSVSLKAEDSSYIGAYSGAAALSKFGYAEDAVNATKAQGMLSGAVAVNDLYKNTTSRLDNVYIFNVGKGRTINDNITNLAQNTGAQVAAGLAMGVELGKKAGGVDINLGGSGSANYVDSTVQAEMTNNIINDYYNVSNIAYDKDLQVGGGINFEFARGNAAVGAAISINDVDNKIKAVMQKNTIGSDSLYANKIENRAVSNLVQVGTATSIGITAGGQKSFFLGDVAIAVNMVDNDVQAVAEDNKILATEFTNEARDGKLTADEADNQYIKVINATNSNDILVDASTGKFYTLDEQGTKHYIIRDGEKFVDEEGNEVDVSAPNVENIVDLDASAALENANGESGAGFGTTQDENGNKGYTSEDVTPDNGGNVIVGSAIGVAVKIAGESSNVAAAVATNVNNINNSFKADTSKNTINALNGVTITADSDTLMVAVAAGAAASIMGGTVTVDAAGSGVDNTLHNDTIASMTDSEIDTKLLNVKSNTKSDLISVAGQLSTAITSNYGGALGLTWAQSTLDNTTGAYARGITWRGYNNSNYTNDMTVSAVNDSGIITVGAGVSGAVANGAVAGAYAGSYGKNDTKAIVEKSDKNKNNISYTSSINVSATDTSDINTVAGTLEGAGSSTVAVTLGGSVANTQLGRHVQASLNDVDASLRSGATVGVLAKDTASTLNLALGGSISVGTGIAGVSAQGTVAVVNADGATTATMNNTNLNSTQNSANLKVEANSDNEITTSADFLGIGGGAEGGGAAGAAVSVFVNSRDTLAQADGGSWEVDEAAVKATSNTKLENITTGVTAAGGEYGSLGVTASVQVNDFDGLTEAVVNNVKGSVSSLDIKADRVTDISAYNNGFAFSVAAFSGSIGAGVTVVDDKSHTLAGLIGSNLQRFDSGGVAVNASNTTNVDTEISSNNVAVSIGAAIGTGVQVVNLEAQAAALVEQSTLGEAGRRFWNLDVNAKNNVTNNFTNVIDSTSIGAGVGVGVGVGVLNMNTQTTATVDDATVYANNINVTADEERNAKALLVGVEVGAIGVGVNLMNTNIGGKLEDAYTYQVWNEETQSYDTYTTYTKAMDGADKESVTDIQGLVDSALGNANAGLGALNGNAVSAFTLNKGSGDGKVAVKVNNSLLDASDKLNVQAQSENNVDNDISQSTVAAGSVAVAGDRTTVQENQSVEVNDTVLKGKNIDISSVNLGSLKHQIEQVGFSLEAYSDTVSYIKHSGENKLYINDSQLTAGDALNITAKNKVEQKNIGLSVNGDVVGAGRLVLEGKDELDVDLQLKAAKGSKLTAKAMQITAENAAKVKNEIEANVSVGLVSAHGASAESRVRGAADIFVGQGNSFTGDSISILAKTGAEDGYTTEALNHAVSVSGVGVSINRALTENSMSSSVNLGAAISISGALDVQALNSSSTNAYVHSVNVGLVAASGDNFAKVEENSEAAITIDTSEGGLDVGSLNVLAQNEQNVTAKADGSGSGLLEISPYTAKVTHEAKANTSVVIKGNGAAGGIFSDGDIKVQALRKENTNLKADALSVTLVGNGDAYVENSSTSDTQVNVTDTEIKNNGKMLLKADNNVQLNKADGYNDMLWGQGYAGVTLNLAGITNTLEQQAKVKLQNSKLNSKGMLDIVSHSEEDLKVNGYVYAVGLGGGSDISLRNKITNNEQIEISDSEVKTSFAYADITMSAADDLKLFTYCLSEMPAGAMGGADSRLFNTIKRTNDIQLMGNTKVYGMHDVNYYAGKNLDGSLGRMDVDSEARNFTGSIIPISLNPTLENNITQHNTLTIDEGSSSMSVRHTNIYADAGEELLRACAVNDTSYSGGEAGGYVTAADGSKYYTKSEDNYVDINGAVSAGMDNKINIVIGEPGDISFFDEGERNALTNKKALSKEELLERITVSGKLTASGTTEGLTDETAQEIRDNIKLGTVDYEETLLKRYNEVIVLMSEYESDGKTSAAYLGYMLEAERLLSEMKKIGELTEVDGVWVLNSKQTLDYIELPELAASGGNIVINTANLKSTAKTGSLDANGSPEINITNNTNLMLKLGAITVDDGGGRLLYNNQELTGKDAAEFNANIAKLNDNSSLDSQFSSIKSETGIGGDITIKGNYSGAPVDFAVEENGEIFKGQYLPKADILVSGDIYNKNGSISITSENNNITIAGESAADSVSILGADVALTAGGSITQTFTDGIVNIGRDVQEVYASEYEKLKHDKKSETVSTKEGGSPANGSAASGSYIAGGVVSINATDINVNGVIQSGYADYEMLLLNDTKDNQKIREEAQTSIDKIQAGYKYGTVLEDSYVKNNAEYQIVKGGAYWDSTKGCYKYRLSAWYNPSTKKILVQDVNASGGKIYLTGRISSTGGGKLISLDGVSNINITSNMDYVLSLGSLITNDVQGLVSITDTAGYVTKKKNLQDVNVIKVTEYTNGKAKTHYVDIDGNIYDDAESTFDKYASNTYNPKSGLRYTWTSGTKSTSYKRYKKDDMDGGWGLWDLNEKEDKLKEWSTEENMTGSGTYDNEARKEGTVIQETTDASSSRMEYEHNQIGEPVITIESERDYNTGFLGCHKHHETIWTESVGSTDTYYASIKADQPIEVKFIGQQADEAVINVQNVTEGIELTGSVGNRQLYEVKDAAGNVEQRNVKGTIKINSGRVNSEEGIIQTNGSLYGRDISLMSSGDIKNINIVAGDTISLYMSSWKNGAMADISVTNLAGAKGDLYLGAEENDEAGTNWGTLDITNTSTSGNIVQLGEVPIVADRINIKTLNGSVSGDNGRAMLIKGGQTPAAGDSLSASVNVTAKGDINLAQYEGDLRVGRIYSQQGDVTLDVAGSVIDALPDNNDAQGSEESRVERWKNIGLIDGGDSKLMAIKSRLNKEKNLGEYKTWDKEALLYAFSESIVNPTAAKLDTASKKDPNIIGHNINITAGGSIGQSGETKEILLTGILARDENGNLKNANAIEDLKALSKADVTNVSLRTDEKGNKIAVIKNVQPLGIQQSEGSTVGKLNIKSTAKGATNGDIFLQGREEVSTEKIFSGKSNNDLNIDKIITENGRVTLTSLGAINKLAENMNDVNIQAQNLYLTALRDIGSLNLKLYGQDIAGDGLSIISGGNVTVNQQGDSKLILRNIAADDINITAENSIVMGTADAGSVDYYLQTEAGHEIKITSQNGDLGEFVYDADGKLLEADSSGLRIKNTSSSKDSNIKLTAEKGRVGLDASAGIEAVKNLEIRAEGDVLLYGGTIGSEKTIVESVNGSIIGYDNDAIESIDVVLTAKKGSVDINRLQVSEWLRASADKLRFSSADIGNGRIEGIDVVLNAKNSSVNLEYLKASGSLKLSGDKLHFGSADIGNGYISVGQEAVFDKLRANGILQAENVLDYLGYDLGDGMSLTLTGGRNHRFDTLFMQGRGFYELDSQRLFAETLLEKAMDYDMHEKLVSPHVRPGLLFSRYNLLEEQDDEKEVSI